MSAKYMHVNTIRHKFGVFFIERRRAAQIGIQSGSTKMRAVMLHAAARPK
jgi:activator of 2-hydroxyglutaryl-CoA dehydratase